MNRTTFAACALLLTTTVACSSGSKAPSAQVGTTLTTPASTTPSATATPPSGADVVYLSTVRGLLPSVAVVEQRDVRSVGAAERDGVDAGRVGVGRSDARGCGNDVAADVDEKAVLDVVGECAARLIDGD